MHANRVGHSLGQFCGCLVLSWHLKPLFLTTNMRTCLCLLTSKVEVVSDVKVLEKEYPCLAAVNRCANSRRTYLDFIAY